MRNCGGTDHLSPTLYHSGLSGDVRAVLRHFVQAHGLRSVALVGYSMGGNLVLKLAGELGEDAPAELRCVVGVSPVVDLAPSADALHETANRLYEQRFLRNLLRRFRRKTMLFPRAFNPQQAAGIGSLRQFDEQITGIIGPLTPGRAVGAGDDADRGHEAVQSPLRPPDLATKRISPSTAARSTALIMS